MKIKIKNSNIFLICSIVFFFYIFYLPKFTELFFNLRSQYIIVVLFLILCIKRYGHLLRRGKQTLFEGPLIRWGVSIFLLSLYTLVISIINSHPIRFFQYFFCVIWLCTLYLFKKTVLEKYLSNRKILEMILLFGVIQGVICLIMLMFPSIKEVANSLAFLNAERNIFRQEKRLFGISNDYTFFTPCYHGFLTSFCVIYSISYNRKFLFAVPFIFLATFLNNRTGVLICILNLFIVLVILFFSPEIKTKTKLRTISISIGVLILLFFVLMIIKKYNIINYEYTIQGVLSSKEYVKELSHNMLYFPTGKAFIFGNGDIQAGVTRTNLGLSSMQQSDIGYVNDMYIGGLLYCVLLYMTNMKFVFTKTLSRIFSVRMFYFDIIIASTLLISNFKGQSMKSGFLIVAMLLIKLIMLDVLKEEKMNNAKINLSHDNI